MGYPAFVRASEGQPDEEFWLMLPEDLKQELNAYIAGYLHPKASQLDGPCCWYDQDLRCCKHHEYRPRVCRDFAVGCADCIGWRRQLIDDVNESDVRATASTEPRRPTG